MKITVNHTITSCLVEQRPKCLERPDIYSIWVGWSPGSGNKRGERKRIYGATVWSGVTAPGSAGLVGCTLDITEHHAVVPDHVVLGRTSSCDGRT